MDLFVQPIDEEDEAAELSRWIWVQCESANCLKWRHIPKHENLDLDKPWFCHMNPDPFFSQCTVPQATYYKRATLKKNGLKVIYSKLPAGSLVLVKASKWPLWPAILSPEPSCNEYVIYDGNGHVSEYHLEFLGRPHTRYWACAHKVEPFRPLSTNVKCLKGTSRHSYKTAMEEAMSMQDLACEERLQLCHFQPENCKFLLILFLGKIWIINTCVSVVLFQAQGLMQSIDKLITDCGMDIKTKQMHKGTMKRHEESKVNQGTNEESIVDAGDALIIEGFRFESAATLKELRQLGQRFLRNLTV
ncbi:hypothetical protein ACEWY4_020167 [Coilia grayii]|uniref:Zinc finger CW-type PWWP domain protein 2 n=1 Tax=Coilia grayii TaxID=363190 RepID=A0ABD1JBW9_9TELE